MTKEELEELAAQQEARIAELEVKLAGATAEKEELATHAAELEAQLAAMHAAAEAREARRAKVPKTCINCGQGRVSIEATATGYHCPACGHRWTDVEEQAPFRRGR